MKQTVMLPGPFKLVRDKPPKGHKFALTITSDEQIEKDMRSFARDLKKMGKQEVIAYAAACLGNWNHSMNERNRALRKVKRLETQLVKLKKQLWEQRTPPPERGDYLPR